MTRLEPPTLGARLSCPTRDGHSGKPPRHIERGHARRRRPSSGRFTFADLSSARAHVARDLEGYGRGANRVDRTPFALGIHGANAVESSTEMP